MQPQKLRCLLDFSSSLIVLSLSEVGGFFPCIMLYCVLPENRYRIRVMTGNRGTNGDVFLKLLGEYGESEEVELTDDMDKSWNKFERGNTDVFSKLLKDVGQVLINIDVANDLYTN